MQKCFVLVGLIILGSGFYQPAPARDGLVGGGIYTTDFGILPAVRIGFDDSYFFDFGLTFSTQDTNNYGFLLKGIGRFAEHDGVFIHGGAQIGVTEIGNDNVFQFGFLIGAEAPINNSFSVTADVTPLGISADGDTEAFIFQGDIGLNIYFR
jgi:hypothetical protein